MQNRQNIKMITFDDFKYVLSLYPIWKNLNYSIKLVYSRGVNFHEVFSEFIVCFVNGYYHSLGEGSEDAFTPDMRCKVQIKGTSNFSDDLTSFGPNSQFDILEFARLDQTKDLLYLYKIPIDELENIHVNKNDTFKDFQEVGKRPRFSIIKQYINKYDIKPYTVVNLITGEFY